MVGLHSIPFSPSTIEASGIATLQRGHTRLYFHHLPIRTEGDDPALYTKHFRTSVMAKDTIALLDFVGWTESRSVHVVGLSMGGMIAQGALVSQLFLYSDIFGSFAELAYRIPERLISLTLAVTTAGGLPIFNLPPVRLVEAFLRDWTKIVNSGSDSRTC